MCIRDSFDLEKDSKETHEAIHDDIYQTRIQKLRQILIQELKSREEGYSDGIQLIAGKQPKNMLEHPFTKKEN